jgi:phytanoyl-CoA hydroxylase
MTAQSKPLNLVEEKAIFDANGYLIVPDLLSPAELAELRERVDRALAGTPPESSEHDIQWEPGYQDRTDLPRANRIRVLFHLSHRDQFFWDHAMRPAIVDRVVNLLGPDVKYYTDQMFVKSPSNGTAVPWHQDSAYWPISPPNVLSCWVAIDDATVENGCVHVLPGSHRRAVTHRSFSDGPQPLGLLDSDVDASREVPIILKAGGCMFHHSLLLHRSAGNTSGKQRRGLVTIYLASTVKQTGPWAFPYEHGFTLIRGKEHAGCI